MDMFKVFGFESLISTMTLRERTEEENNLIIPSWLFYEKPTQIIFMAQINFREPLVRPTDDSIIPVWLFRNMEEKNRNLIREFTRTNSNKIGDMFLDKFNVVTNDRSMKIDS